MVCKSLKRLERVKGIEPSSSAWKAVALPLSYTRVGAAAAAAGERPVCIQCRHGCRVADGAQTRRRRRIQRLDPQDRALTPEGMAGMVTPRLFPQLCHEVRAPGRKTLVKSTLKIDVVGEVGLEPTKAKPADLQSAPFAARDTPPQRVDEPSSVCAIGAGTSVPAVYGDGGFPCQPRRPRRDGRNAG